MKQLGRLTGFIIWAFVKYVFIYELYGQTGPQCMRPQHEYFDIYRYFT